MLESFDNHPPIILPSGGFKVDLEVETLDDNIYRHLLYIRHFLWSLQSRSPHTSEGPGSALPKVACIPPEGVVPFLGGQEGLGSLCRPLQAQCQGLAALACSALLESFWKD